MFRVLLSLKKDSSIKYISHLDLMQAFEYALRRSGLPIAFSEGFNPRPKMSFGNAVGVGVSSDDERVVLEFTEPITAKEVMQKLNFTLPPGLRILWAQEVPENDKSPLSRLNASDYEIVISSPDVHKVENLISEILRSDEYFATRMKSGEEKKVNFRPYLIGLKLLPSEDGTAVILASFRVTNSGAGRPQDIVQVICEHVPEVEVLNIKRIRQYGEDIAPQSKTNELAIADDLR